MCAVISSATLERCSRSTVPGKYNYAMRSFNEKPFLVNQLFEYYMEIGVTGYEEDEDGVRWLFENNWYDQDQIDRILKMKAFA